MHPAAMMSNLSLRQRNGVERQMTNQKLPHQIMGSIKELMSLPSIAEGRIGTRVRKIMKKDALDGEVSKKKLLTGKDALICH